MQGQVTGISHRGEGIVRIDGKAIFVPGAIPEETIELDIVEDRSRYGRGKIGRIVTSSPHRIEPICPYYEECGGCDLQHISYSHQLELKTRIVNETMQKLGNVKAPVLATAGMDTPWRYRNKVTWHVATAPGGKKELGYYSQKSHRIIPVDKCYLVSEKMEAITNKLREMIQNLEFKQTGSVVVRESPVNGDIMLILQNLEKAPHKHLCRELSGLVDSLYIRPGKKLQHLFGPQKLRERLGKVDFELSPDSFFQVNHLQAEKMLVQTLEYVQPQPNENILDVYCGVGSISLNAALKAAQVTGIESFSPAIQDARANTILNHLDNCSFRVGRAEDILPAAKLHFDTIILDPPRAGLAKGVAEAVTAAEPQKIIYVSCNPSTLARDLARFQTSGYGVKQIQPIDMFPQTYHVETVVKLYKEN